jgi:hypothetical protein
VGASKQLIRHAYPPGNGVITRAWFNTNGATDPTAATGLSAHIDSVARLTDNASSEEFYRVTFKEAIYRTSTSIYREAADVNCSATVRLDAKAALRTLAPAGGATPTAFQVDILVTDHSTATPAYTNQVAAGHRIYLEICEDKAA